jgi:hypothetical protein
MISYTELDGIWGQVSLICRSLNAGRRTGMILSAKGAGNTTHRTCASLGPRRKAPLQASTETDMVLMLKTRVMEDSLASVDCFSSYSSRFSVCSRY